MLKSQQLGNLQIIVVGQVGAGDPFGRWPRAGPMHRAPGRRRRCTSFFSWVIDRYSEICSIHLRAKAGTASGSVKIQCTLALEACFWGSI